MPNQIIRLSVTYFLTVFAAGCVFGSIRVPFVQPLIGTRYAELLELPLMLMVIWRASKYTVRQLKRENSSSLQPLLVGCLALGWLMTVELGAAALFRGGWNGIRRYILDRDPVAGPAFALAVLVYMLMPVLEWRSRRAR